MCGIITKDIVTDHGHSELEPILSVCTCAGSKVIFFFIYCPEMRPHRTYSSLETDKKLNGNCVQFHTIVF